MEKVILITGIGGNVGQGIIRNLRSDFQNIKVIGCNTIDFTAGNHLCDVFYKVPYAYDLEYIKSINNIVNAERVDLIIPSTDFEVYYLSKQINQINTKIAVSEVESSEIYLDKYLTFLHHQKSDIPFAKSYLPSQYSNQFQNFILKPRKGRGSRGLHINPDNISGFEDEDYMIQELHYGKELTTAFYISQKNKLHGHITLVRELENGATSQCKVESSYDGEIVPILEQMIKHGKLKGAINLQSIVKEDGTVTPFEVNCRISGTNSIRSNFGFKDVRYTIQEYLYDIEPDAPNVINGIAVRILMDVIYPNALDYKDCISNTENFIF